MRYMGRGTRNVVKMLKDMGIPLETNEEFYQVEVACTYYYPNHIIGVIQKIMGKGDVIQKFFKAQDHGWAYFAKPIDDMLGSRDNARNPHYQGPVSDTEFNIKHHVEIYNMVCCHLLAHDINIREVNMLLWAVPLYCDDETLLEAIHICKDRGIRNIPYLYGILERRDADLRARIRDRDEDVVDVWVPGKNDDTIEGDKAADEWAGLNPVIQSMKDINAKSPRHRRRS